VIQLTWEEITTRGAVCVPAGCRALVELTTHPDRLAIVNNRSPAWAAWGVSVDGEAIRHGGVAATAAIDRTLKWGERGLESARATGDDAATRLGARDVRIEVNWQGAVVPSVRSVNVPGWLWPPSVDPETVVAGLDGFVAERLRFTYGRYGLEWSRT
jgi:hypothetical protein